jgi:hypothetical protein
MAVHARRRACRVTRADLDPARFERATPRKGARHVANCNQCHSAMGYGANHGPYDSIGAPCVFGLHKRAFGGLHISNAHAARPVCRVSCVRAAYVLTRPRIALLGSPGRLRSRSRTRFGDENADGVVVVEQCSAGVTIVRLSCTPPALRMSLRSGTTESCLRPDQGARHVTCRPTTRDLRPARCGRRRKTSTLCSIDVFVHVRCLAYR